METKKSQIEIIRTQRVLNNYIEYNKDIDKFTKYVVEQNARRKNKTDNQNQNNRK